MGIYSSSVGEPAYRSVVSPNMVEFCFQRHLMGYIGLYQWISLNANNHGSTDLGVVAIQQGAGASPSSVIMDPEESWNWWQ